MDDILDPNTTQQELLRLILKESFYEANKDHILDTMFASNLKPVFRLIKDAHDKHHRDITLSELKALYKTTYPTTTTAQWANLNAILDQLPTDISDEVAKTILKRAWIIERGRKIAEIGINIANQKTQDFTPLRTILEKIENGSLSDDEVNLEAVSNDLEDILDAINVSTRWNFYLEPLRKVCSGIGPGIFTVIAARVETGKTAKLVSLCAAPGGLADQGARVAYFCNEEPAQRTQGRAVMCFTGMNLQELMLDPDKARKNYTIKDNLKFFECRGKTIDELERFINRNRFDICVFDMLDKLSINATFTRDDERLGALYERARNIGVRHQLAVVGSSQLNAEAEGKVYISTANLANSRTAKAAEADLLIGIGKIPGHEENTRVLNIAKNKITGSHQDVVCMIRPEISRYVA